MTKTARIRAAALALLAAVAIAPPAHAQTANGFALDRFNPSERGSDWFVLDSLDLRGHLRPAFGVVGEYGYRPLVLYNVDGSSRSEIVRHQLFLHLGAAVNLWDRLRLGADFPIAAWQDGNGGTLNGVTYPAGTSGGLGDLRLGADVRLLGTYGDAFTLAAGVQVFLPTGDRGSYLGDGAVRLLPRAQVAGDVGWFAYAASLGFLYRGQDDPFANSARGSEVVFAASGGVRALDRKLIVGPEIYGATVVSAADAVFAKRQTPFEALLGAHYTVGSDFRLGAGGGPGLTRGLGEPALRIVASIEWMPAIVEKKPEPPPPLAPPPPPPPPDRDGDGVPDADDACPDVPGVKTADPKTNGCPPDLDRDKDGIPNDTDACPDEPGRPDADPKKNGCPKAFIKDNQIKILDQVKFATNSAAIAPGKESAEVLEAILAILKEHPEITKVLVEGHTDNAGDAGYNKKLSAQRAASVVKWLAQHGIDTSRLTSAGFGMERPISPNTTPEGRKDNRRVEFHIEDKAPPK